MTNKVYDILKWVALVGLPALTALWLTLANIWGFPYAEAIGATLAAVATFLGAVLGISSINYAKKIITEKGEK
jgi:Kef-type K+ transport system membrane component KefB